MGNQEWNGNLVHLWLANFFNFHTRLVNSDCSRKLTSSGLSLDNVDLLLFCDETSAVTATALKITSESVPFQIGKDLKLIFIIILHLCLHTFVFDEGFVDCIAESCTSGSLRQGSRPRVSLLVLHQVSLLLS